MRCPKCGSKNIEGLFDGFGGTLSRREPLPAPTMEFIEECQDCGVRWRVARETYFTSERVIEEAR